MCKIRHTPQLVVRVVPQTEYGFHERRYCSLFQKHAAHTNTRILYTCTGALVLYYTLYEMGEMVVVHPMLVYLYTVLHRFRLFFSHFLKKKNQKIKKREREKIHKKDGVG